MSLKEIFDGLFRRSDKSARNVARDRLRLVLMSDRAAIPGPTMDLMRKEILMVVSKYVDIDEAALEIALERAEDGVALIANIPIRQVRGSSL